MAIPTDSIRNLYGKLSERRFRRRLLIAAVLVFIPITLGTSAGPPLRSAISAESGFDLPGLQIQKTVENFMGLDEIGPYSNQEEPFTTAGGFKKEDLLDLSLNEAIRLALETHLMSRNAREKIEESIGRRWQLASALLPHVSAGMFQQRTFRENLAALGFKQFGMIGPFNTFDARFQLMQRLIDLSALSRFQAGRKDVNIARYEEKLARQKVTLLTSLAYLEALRAYGVLKAAQADFKLAQRLFAQASHQHEAGLATGVDVARADTRIAQAQLRIEKARNDVHGAYLELQRVSGLSYDSVIRLINSLCFIDEIQPPVDEAITAAKCDRVEMQIAAERIRASQYRLYGARAEMLPKIDFSGDLGLSGNKGNRTAREVGDIMFSVHMPLLEGGKIKGEIQEASSQKKQAEIFYDDLTRQVEEDVRLALWTTKTSIAQVRSAGKVVTLSERELELANDRFRHGVGDNVEVVDAQATLAQAQEDYLSALSGYHAARINLYFALGKAESFYLQNTTQKKE